VIGVTRETTQCDICHEETGVRVVQMRLSVDEVKCLPHIVTFRCGTKGSRGPLRLVLMDSLLLGAFYMRGREVVL